MTVTFEGESLAIPIAPDCLVGEWHGPKGFHGAKITREVVTELEKPLSYPELRRAIVPGDRVVVAFDPRIAELRLILEEICAMIASSGVAIEDITLLATHLPAAGWDAVAPSGVQKLVHDPEDRTQLAYLATTEAGRRVYLSRAAVDADFLMTLGSLAHDRVRGPQGPWSTLFPGLSDTETLRDFRSATKSSNSSQTAMKESSEVGWLVGNQFQIGVLPGATGVCRIIAGLASDVSYEGMVQISKHWRFEVEARADLVIAGVGEAGVPTDIEDLAAAFGNATRLVRRGGRIVVLSRAKGEFGPAFQRLMNLDDPRSALAALKGAEDEPDYAPALEIARSLAWADLYLLSNLGEDAVETLGITPLTRPEEAVRLAKASPSVVLLSRAERTRTSTTEDDE